MAVSEDKMAELRVKNLEMIQAIVTRTAGYSAGLKTTTVTLIAAVLGLALGLRLPSLIWAGFVPLAGFAYLDARYLKTERWFRAHFREVTEQDWASMPKFRLELGQHSENTWLMAMRSWSIWPFYGLLSAMLILVRCLWST